MVPSLATGRFRRGHVVVPVAVLFLLVPTYLMVGGVTPSGGFAVSSTPRTAMAPAVTGVSTLCTLPGNDTYGIYPAKGGGAYVEDGSTGWLIFCDKGHGTIIANPPLMYPGYWGMAGVVISGSLDLLLSNAVKDGFYYCKGVTPTGVASCSGFISLPCTSSAPQYYCPYGIATDGKLNIYFVENITTYPTPTTPKAVECTSASGYAKCRTLYTFPTGSAPVAITRYNGTLWFADDSCVSGDIWKGSILAYTLPPPDSALTSIAWSSDNPSKTPNLYVGDSGYSWPSGLYCGFSGFVAQVLDVSTLAGQPTPFTGANIIPGLDSTLQFTNGADKAYKTT